MTDPFDVLDLPTHCTDRLRTVIHAIPDDFHIEKFWSCLPLIDEIISSQQTVQCLEKESRARSTGSAYVQCSCPALVHSCNT